VRFRTRRTANFLQLSCDITLGRTSVMTYQLPGGSDAFGLIANARPIVALSVSRELGIDPYFVRYSPLAHSGAATTPSVAEIYVNGQLVRRERIAPGASRSPECRRLPGAGDATVILRLRCSRPGCRNFTTRWACRVTNRNSGATAV
jgi:hypothetical protein